MKQEELKAWAEASGREFIVFRTSDLIDALPYPEGVEQFQQIIRAYGRHRSVIASDRSESVPERGASGNRSIPCGRRDALDAEEKKRLVLILIGEIQANEPGWAP